MLDRFRSLIHGAGGTSWIFYLVVFSAALYLVFPSGGGGLAGALAGFFSAIRVELNGYRQRLERLEAKEDRGAASTRARSVEPNALSPSSRG